MASRKGLEGQSEQGVAGQDGHRFAELDVTGRATAAEVVVVNSGQIVVDQGEGVHHLERASGVQGLGRVSAYGFAGGETERRAQAFAWCERRVAHGLVKGPGLDFHLGKEGVQARVDQRPVGRKSLLPVHGGQCTGGFI